MELDWGFWGVCLFGVIGMGAGTGGGGGVVVDLIAMALHRGAFIREPWNT